MDNNTYFDKKASTYDSDDKKLFWMLSDDILEYYFNKYFESGNFKNILDIGCGTGKWIKKILEYSPLSNLTGIDINKKMLEEAKNKIVAENISLLNCDLLDMPFEDEQFDLVYGIHSIPFSLDVKKAFSEIYRVLNPGGTLICTLFNAFDTIALSNLTNNILESRKIIDTKCGHIKGKPDINYTFSEDIEYLCKLYNFNIVSFLSYPVVNLNGVRERLTENKYSAKDILSDSETYDQLFNMEIELIEKYAVKDRGFYQLLIAKKC